MILSPLKKGSRISFHTRLTYLFVKLNRKCRKLLDNYAASPNFFILDLSNSRWA